MIKIISITTRKPILLLRSVSLDVVRPTAEAIIVRISKIESTMTIIVGKTKFICQPPKLHFYIDSTIV